MDFSKILEYSKCHNLETLHEVFMAIMTIYNIKEEKLSNGPFYKKINDMAYDVVLEMSKKYDDPIWDAPEEDKIHCKYLQYF